MTSWKTSQKPIVVGLLLDEQDSGLLKTATSLARQLGSSLELVHAVRPVFNYIGAGDVVVNPYYGYDWVLNDVEEQQSRQRIELVKKSLASNLTVNTHIVRDYPAEALSTIAHEVRAGMVLCGIQLKASKSLLGGLSTAFSLAAHAECPVMLLPITTSIDFQSPSTLLIADNLEAEGRIALESGLRLAQDLTCRSIVHAHVHNLGRPEIDHIVEQIRTAMTLGTIPNNPKFSSEFYQDTVRQRIVDELVYRYHNTEGVQLLDSQYQPAVRFGEPADQLHQLVKEHKAQIMVFGRHHMIHKKNFAFGKIPYQAMIEDQVASFIVPDLERPRLMTTKPGE